MSKLGFPNEPCAYNTIFENKFFVKATLNVFINYVIKMMKMVFWGFGRSIIVCNPAKRDIQNVGSFIPLVFGLKPTVEHSIKMR